MSTIAMVAVFCLLGALLNNAAATAPVAFDTNSLSNYCLPGDLDDYGSSDSSSGTRNRPSTPRKSPLSDGSSHSTAYASACGGSSSIITGSPRSDDPSNLYTNAYRTCSSKLREGSLSSRDVCHPPSPPSLPSPFFSLPQTPPSAPTSLHLNRSNMQFSHFSHPQQSPHFPAKSAVIASASTPSFLTEEILALGEDALLCYDAVRGLCLPEDEYPIRERNPFSMLNNEDLEKYFAAAVDAKNALQLRKSVVGVDISDALEGLLPKLSLYEKDGAVLESAFYDMRLIQEESLNRSLHLNFYSLEFFRRSLPSHRLSVLERYHSLFSALERILDEKGYAQQATVLFMKDPYCLREHRLEFSSAFQR